MKAGMIVWVKQVSNVKGAARVLGFVGWNSEYVEVRFENGQTDVFKPSWLEDICQECQMPACDCA
jgi:hypothetical protein